MVSLKQDYITITNNVLDEWARLYLVMFYWPYFVAGNIDNWKELFICRK